MRTLFYGFLFVGFIAWNQPSLAEPTPDGTWQEMASEAGAHTLRGEHDQALVLAVRAHDYYLNNVDFVRDDYAGLLRVMVYAAKEARGDIAAVAIIDRLIPLFESQEGDLRAPLIDLHVLRAEFQRGFVIRKEIDLAMDFAREHYGENSKELADEWMALLDITTMSLFQKSESTVHRILKDTQAAYKAAGEISPETAAKLRLAEYRLEAMDGKTKIVTGLLDLASDIAANPFDDSDALLFETYKELAKLYGERGQDAELDALLPQLAALAPDEGPSYQIFRAQPKVSRGQMRRGSFYFANYRFNVAVDGRPFDVEVVEASDQAGWDDVALKALQRGRWVPKLVDGQLVPRTGVSATIQLRTR